MPSVVCIYCRACSDKPFPRDHVIPQSFGRFKGDIALRCVCPACNSYFGRQLEWFLNRDSGEALIRARLKLKPKKAGHLKSRRIKITVDVPGPWMGARVLVKPDPSGAGLETELIPQVALRNKGEGKWAWFTIDKLRDAAALSRYRKNSEIRIIGPTEKVVRKLVDILNQLGIPFTEQGQLDDPIDLPPEN